MFQITTVSNGNDNKQNNNSNDMGNQEGKKEGPKYNYKSIIELQKEISHFQNKERLYKLQLLEKEKKINELKEIKAYYESKKNLQKSTPPDEFSIEHISNQKVQKLLLALKKIIEEKNSFLLALELELYSTQSSATNFFCKQLKILFKENTEILTIFHNIDNFMKENNNEKQQLNALLIKIAECQENINELIKNLDEVIDTSALMKRKFNNKEN